MAENRICERILTLPDKEVFTAQEAVGMACYQGALCKAGSFGKAD